MSLLTNIFDKDYYKGIYYGLLLFISLTPFANEVCILFFPISIFILEWKFIVEKIKNFKSNIISKNSIAYFWIPFTIILLSYLNKFFFGEEINSIRGYYAAFLLLPLVLISGVFIQNIYLIRTFILLISIEVVIGIFEYIYGVRSFILTNSPELQISDKTLLYNSRIYGLSLSSSVFAVKLFCSFILLNKGAFKKNYFYIAATIIVLGIILTFNRAVIVAVLFLLVSYIIFYLIRFKLQIKRLLQFQFFNVSFLLVLLVLIFNSEVYYQFSRGESIEVNTAGTKKKEVNENHALPSGALLFKEINEFEDVGSFSGLFLGKTSKLNASGRNLIWANYAWFIERNLIFGNGSDKLMLYQFIKKKNAYEKVHAHNSFLMILSTNGLIITLLYLLWYFLLWKGKNFLIILCILVYSLFQYGIFWGISLLDIVFIALLISPSNFISIGYKTASGEN